MEKRAKKVARTEKRIMEAVTCLWKDFSINEITLEKVAELADVSVRTLIRKYSSKEGLFEECIKKDAANIEKVRANACVGDIESIVTHLMNEYEEYGDAVARTLAVEDDLDIAGKILAEGRRYHKQWCARVFAPFLPEPEDNCYENKLMAFVAATDLYMWKLIRRDHQKSREECYSVFTTLITGLTANI